jgi:hypothetical protein
MEYVVDVLENTLNKEEAEKYYEKSIVEMNQIEREPYLKNEIKYINFLKQLFFLNEEMVEIKINSICSADIDEFFDEEKFFFLKELRKIEDLMLKNELLIKNFNDIIYCIKLSYRDYTAGANKLELQYKNIGLVISSNSDYTYILETLNDLGDEVKVIAKKNSMFLKKLIISQSKYS